MNAGTLKKTLDEYGFETEKVLDCLLDIFIKQNVSDKGVLAEEVPQMTGILLGYRLIKKDSWNKRIFFRCTPKGERIARELFVEKVNPVFEEFKNLNLEGSYLIVKYLTHLVNQGKNTPLKRPELKLLSPLPVIHRLQSSMMSVLLEHGLAREIRVSTRSEKVAVTVPDLYTYFEPYYPREERILSFEQLLKVISRKLNLFRVLYFYEPKAEKMNLRRLKDYNFSLEDIIDILNIMKQKGIINYSYNPILFRIEDKIGYKRFLKENVLSEILDEFSRKLQQPIHTNPEAYAVLAEFEEEFRTFLEETLKSAQEKWEERIPEDVLTRLKERQNDAQIRKKTVYPLLHYIDFPNYLSIILHRTNKFNNWEVFEPYFISIGWIKGRLIEMNEIRNDLAHPKPLESLQYRKLQLYIDEIRERIRR